MPLQRVLGLRNAVAIGLGSMVGAGLFVVWGPATTAAGRWVLVALMVAGVVALCNALSSAALGARYPQAGGTYHYGRERLGELPGFLAGWCFVVGKTASCAAMALTIGAYTAPGGGQRLVAVLAVLLVTGLNLRGVTRSARASEVIVAVVLTVVISLGVSVLLRLGAGGAALETVGPPVDPGPWGVLQGAGLLFFAFAGYARIATLGEEVRDPERTIPQAVMLALGIVVVLYAVVGVMVFQVLGVSGTAASTAPLAQVAEQVWGQVGVSVLAATAAVAALGALLNLVLGISRTGLAMARGGHLPSGLATVGRTLGVPWVAEVVVGAVVLTVVLVVDLRGAIGFSSFGVLLYYAVANAAAWTLRGDWRPAGVVPVVGLIGCLVLVAALPLSSVLSGLVVVGLGLFWYAVGRRPLTVAESDPSPRK